jgi:MOSC domain-containing protein YiiM
VARVSHIFIAVERRKAMKPIEEAQAVTNRGLQGCLHGRPGSRRQVLLVDIETLREFGLSPGTIRENITTEGLNLAELRPGQQLCVGEAALEVTIPCEPCDRMDEIRVGLQKGLENRRGILCRVIEGGRICRGDAIEILNGSLMPPMEERVEQERRS